MTRLAFPLRLAALLAFGSLAHASLISIGLQQAGYNNGEITTVATDGGSGTAIFSGAYGTFNANTITAIGAPIRLQGNLSTTSVQISNTTPTAATLFIYITEQGLTSPRGRTSFLSAFTANLFTGSAISITGSTYFDDDNDLYGGTELASRTFTGQGTSSQINLADLTGTYSETIRYAFTMGSTNASTNNTINLTTTSVTPEPSSLILLGTGLFSVAGLFMHRRHTAHLAL